MMSWAEGNLEYEFDGRRVGPCDPAVTHRYASELRRFVARTRAAGARPVIATYPVTVDDARTHAARRNVACANRVRRSVGADVVDLATHYCPAPAPCVVSVGGTPLRPDGVHFRGPGASDAGAWIADRLWAAPAPPSSG
jgi:hypothetical protein